MTKEQIKESLIANGVKNLQSYGYSECTAENIFSDEIYFAFFKSMLEDNLGKGGEMVDEVINELLNSN